METYSRRRYEESKITGEFVQDNVSFSRRGVLKGLHFQNPNSQGKLLSAQMGDVFGVAADVRVGPPAFCRAEKQRIKPASASHLIYTQREVSVSFLV
jgi:dTDP-4-dehydrorhamnose 3,5-epimerase